MKMKLLKDATQEQMRKQVETLKSTALGALDAGGKMTRAQLISAVKHYIGATDISLQKQAMSPQKLNDNELAALMMAASISHTYTIALCEMMIDGNTQWNDDDLFVEQFKHRLTVLFDTVAFMDPDSGKVYRGDDKK